MKKGTILYLSTTHVTSKTAGLLNTCAFNNDKLNNGSKVHAKGLYGWFVEILENTDNLNDDIKSCMELAKAEQCEWLVFDREADVISALPTYKW